MLHLMLRVIWCKTVSEKIPRNPDVVIKPSNLKRPHLISIVAAIQATSTDKWHRMQTIRIFFSFIFPIFSEECCGGRPERKTGTVLLNVGLKESTYVMIKCVLSVWLCSWTRRKPALQSCGGGNVFDAVHRVCEQPQQHGLLRGRRRSWRQVLPLWDQVLSGGETFWKIHVQVNNCV